MDTNKTYKPADLDFIIMAGHYRDKTYDNRDMKKKFLSSISERIEEIDKVLVSFSLPLDFSVRENIKIIDKWVLENAETNNISLEANKRNNNLLKEKYIFKTKADLPFEKERDLTYVWKSIIYDLTVKLAETKRLQHPELYWKIQTQAKRFGSYKRLCLYGTYDPYGLVSYIDVFSNTSSMLESHLVYEEPRILNETRNFLFTFDQIEKAMDENYLYDPLMNLNRNVPSAD